MVENIQNTKVKTLRSDNGGEYTSEEFNMYLANHGIKHQLTTHGTPEQNGVAEGMNQTLLDMTRCLLIESGVTKELWADAVVTASYIRNKCPSKAVGGESPEALWTGGRSETGPLKSVRVQSMERAKQTAQGRQARAESGEVHTGRLPIWSEGVQVVEPKGRSLFCESECRF
ncbi:hypothetical protein MTO96_033251 [Rhipicephalus appendiculatus]